MNQFNLNVAQPTADENPALYKSFGISEERSVAMAKKIDAIFKAHKQGMQVNVGEIIKQTAAECETLEEVAYFSFAIGGFIESKKVPNPLSALAAMLAD